MYRRRMGHVQRQDENKKTDVHTHTNRVHCFTQYFDDIPFLEAAKREANLVRDTHDQLGDTLKFDTWTRKHVHVNERDSRKSSSSNG